MIKIFLFSVLVSVFSVVSSGRCSRNDLGRERFMETGPTKMLTPMCIYLDSSDVCYSGGFSRANEWNLGIVLSEQTQENILNKRETMPYPYPSEGGFKNVNRCVRVNKPKVCFKNYNPLLQEKGIVWKLESPLINFKRISTKASFFQRWFSAGPYYSDVVGSIDLSWNNATQFKWWHGAFQLFRNGEQPRPYPLDLTSLRYEGFSRNDKHTKIEIGNLRVIFSEKPDDVLLWDMTPLTFIGTVEENTFFDSNSQFINNKNDVCLESIRGNICILDPEVPSSTATINFNIGEGKPRQNLPIQNAPHQCLPTLLEKVCMHKNLHITTNVSSLPYQDPWVVNPLYFVPSILPSQEDGRIKFFCNQFNGTICFNSKMGVPGSMVSNIELHQKDKNPALNFTDVVMDVHQCVRTCPFDICFTENDYGNPWVLKSIFYFTEA
ncbi:hypothetical protein IIV31_153L [Armadillidium vulgare iridescent virus]|uniref:Uncharacterized protein n=1 Tax=Armadillidium vulgare iridescent virus TaxID=72201 RepID=A0A068QL55_9VIRU|nr:hypothetical protein IIV31_153L [Armadillidium vulgare iridescent virus]CCV02525.1 hypothetical protein IIV31_153L [Armadillidium vulgare iridescent virus]